MDSQVSMLHRVKVVYEEDCYLLCGAVSPAADTVAVAHSSHVIKLYSLSELAAVGEFAGHQDMIRDVRFDPTTPQRLVSCDAQGNVVAWDTRAGSQSASPLRLDLVMPEEVFSIDVSCDGLRLAVGDGFDVAVFDTRMPGAPVNRVQEFHTDRICRVRCHPAGAPMLTSGSDDGLAIVMDTSQPDEDDVAVHIFNLQNGVTELSYLPHGGGPGLLTTITSCEDVAMYSLETGDEVLAHPRPEDWLYAAGIVGVDAGPPVVLWGVMGEDQVERHGELMMCPMGGNTVGSFKGHDGIVRFTLPATDGRLLTGGEDGFLCLWGSGDRAVANPHRVGAGPAHRRANEEAAPAAAPAQSGKVRSRLKERPLKKDAPYA
eukprot:TRINITY_DN39422_c0_g1_i1.p1 TRINITY_DN39422_c0_g1~~TRINITY_DN39422_c0_g1_i1.p1  ORF type:complete len:397 (+),score=117.81 TRINITY_DN39422_c0_g1_i1:73-1191(+)